MSAESGAAGSPAGGGMRAMTASSTSSTPSPVLALHADRVVRGDADDVLDLGDDAVGLGRGQVDLVQHRDDGDALLGRRVAVGDRLRLDPLRRVDDEQRALAGGERARHLVGEVDVARRVDQVEVVDAARRAPCR